MAAILDCMDAVMLAAASAAAVEDSPGVDVSLAEATLREARAIMTAYCRGELDPAAGDTVDASALLGNIAAFRQKVREAQEGKHGK